MEPLNVEEEERDEEWEKRSEGTAMDRREEESEGG